MTNLDCYAAAALPVRPRVCGKWLRPFTVGHALLLHRLESPFITNQAIPEWGDLILAVEILSRPPLEAEESLGCKWMRFALGTLWPIRLLWWRRSIQDEIEKFETYLDAAMATPMTWSKPEADNSQPSGSPFVLQLLVAQMAWLGKSESDALNTPYSSALWQVYTAGEMKGSLQIVSDRERAVMEAMSV